MTDVHKINQPSGAPEPTGKQKPKEPDADKFKREMDYKVHESDSEQKGKKKERPAQEEEDEAELANAPQPTEPAPPSGTFSLEPKQPNPFDVKSKTSPLGSAEPSKSQQAPQKDFSPSTPVSPNVQEADIGTSTTPSSPNDTGYFSDNEPFSFQPSENTSENTPNRTDSSHPHTPDATFKKKDEVLKKQEELRLTSKPHQKGPSKEGHAPTPLPSAHPTETRKESAEKLFEKGVRGREGLKSGVGEEVKGTPQVKSSSKGEKNEEEDLSSLFSLPTAPTPLDLSTGQPPPLQPSPAPLPHEIFEIFEKMVGLIMVMSTPDKTDTVVTLNSPQYANSKFFGTKITITQYKTDPGAFKIKLEGDAAATKDFTKNSDNLLAAFKYGNYNFRVREIEVSLLREEERKGIVRRKESTSGENN